jgi:hypothetical protein
MFPTIRSLQHHPTVWDENAELERCLTLISHTCPPTRYAHLHCTTPYRAGSAAQVSGTLRSGGAREDLHNYLLGGSTWI